MRKETVGVDILVTSKNGDRKIMLSMKKMSRPPLRIRKWNQLSQFRWTSTKVIPIENEYLYMNPCFTTLFYHILPNVKPYNGLFSHISSLLATIAYHFLHYLLVDQLYAKEVYFCSFVTKFNKAFTRYSPNVFNSFYWTAAHGESLRIFTSPPQTRFPHISL